MAAQVRQAANQGTMSAIHVTSDDPGGLPNTIFVDEKNGTLHVRADTRPSETTVEIKFTEMTQNCVIRTVSQRVLVEVQCKARKAIRRLTSHTCGCLPIEAGFTASA